MSDNPFEAPSESGFASSSEDLEGEFAPVPLSIGEIINRSWAVFRDNLGIVLGVFGVIIAVAIVFAVVSQVATMAGAMALASADVDPDLAPLLIQLIAQPISLVQNAVLLWISLGSGAIMIRLVRGQYASFGMLFQQTKYFLGYFAAVIVVGIVSVPAFLLLIVPAIILSIVTSQVLMVMVAEDERNPINAVRRSIELTWPNFWFLLGFYIVFGIGSLLFGLVTLCLGFLLVGAIQPVINAVVYQALAEDHRLRMELGAE